MGGSGATGRALGSGSRVGDVRLTIDPEASDPPFRQLKNQILDAVKRGALPPGTRLPAVRSLATDAGVAANTAAKVYRELEEAGVLEGRGRSGTFVAAADLPGAVLTRAAGEYAELAAGSGFTLSEALTAVRVAFSHFD